MPGKRLRATSPPNGEERPIADLYFRLSDFRADGTTFEERKPALVAHAASRGWTVGEVIIENDENPTSTRNASAFKRREVLLPDGRVEERVYRPGFRRLLDRLHNGLAHAVVAEDLDRAMRDPYDLEDLMAVIARKRLNADSPSGKLRFTDGGTDSEVFSARIMVAVANQASRDAVRRSRNGRRRSAENGRFGGGRRPYGFEKDGLTPIEAEYALVRNAIDLLLLGVPLKKQARDLNEAGVPTATGKLWHMTTLRDIIRRPRTGGWMEYRGVIIGKAPWPPMVDDDVWRSALDLLNSRSVGPNVSQRRYLGTGLFQCVCGATVGSQVGTARPPSYRCLVRGTGHVRRDMKSVDQYVTDVIVARLEQPDAIDLLDPPPDAPTVDVNALRTKVAMLRSVKRNLAAQLGTTLDAEDLAVARKANRQALDEALAQLDGQRQTRPIQSIVGSSEPREIWAAASLGLRQLIIARLAVVTILPTKKGSGFYPSSVRVSLK